MEVEKSFYFAERTCTDLVPKSTIQLEVHLNTMFSDHLQFSVFLYILH